MDVFLSWSGDRSKKVAEALKEWLPVVLDNVKPWLSEADIQAGERWAIEVGYKLEKINFGIICLTRENLESPWILFEAGALSKSLEEGRVCPYLFNVEMRELTAPLSQFQAKRTEKDSTLELIKAINRVGHQTLEETILTERFEAFWPRLLDSFGAIPESSAGGKPPRNTDEILEDIVETVRNSDRKLSELDSRLVYIEVLAERRKESQIKISTEWNLIMQSLKQKRQALTAAVYGEAEAVLDEDLMMLLFQRRSSSHIRKMAADDKHLENLLDSVEEVYGFRPKEVRMFPEQI